MSPFRLILMRRSRLPSGLQSAVSSSQVAAWLIRPFSAFPVRPGAKSSLLRRSFAIDQHSRMFHALSRPSYPGCEKHLGESCGPTQTYPACTTNANGRTRDAACTRLQASTRSCSKYALRVGSDSVATDPLKATCAPFKNSKSSTAYPLFLSAVSGSYEPATRVSRVIARPPGM